MKKLVTLSLMFCSLMLTAQISQRTSEKPQEGKVLFNAVSVREPGAIPPENQFQVNRAAVAPDCTVNGITISTSGTTTSPYVPATAPITCTPLASGVGDFPWTGWSSTGVVTYTFSAPVSSVRVSYSAANGQDDVGTINVNGGGVLSLSNPCGINVSGNVVTCNFPTPYDYGDISVTVSSTLPFTTITLVNTGGNSGFVGGNPCNFEFPCSTSNVAPIFRTRTLSNVCPATRANLNSLFPGNQPFGTQLTWHTGTPATAANQVFLPGAVGSGTFYASYYDPNGNCYGPTTPIVVTIVRCTADLQITKTSNVSTASVGSTVIFTITATNNGPSPATGVNVSDVLPSGFAFVSATTSVGFWSAPTWTINNLAVGASETLTLVTTVTSAGNYSNTATISGNQGDPDTSNNTATASVRVRIPLYRIEAFDDDFRRRPFDACAGGITPSVFSNDLINGASFLYSTVTASLVAPLSIPGATIDADGQITIPSGTLPGSYMLTYTVCVGGGLPCDTANVYIDVNSTSILAFNDNFLSTPISSLVGGQTPTVLTNDTYYNGVFVSLVFSPFPGATIDQAGVITVPAGVPAGNYTLVYQLTDCFRNISQAKVDIAITRRIIIIDPEPFDPIFLKQIVVYPNPSKGDFTVLSDGLENFNAEIQVFNQMGKSVYQSSGSIKQARIDLTNAPKGIYFLTISTDSGSVQKKLVIE